MDSFVKIIADGLVVPIMLIGAYALLFKVPKGTRIEAYSRVLVAGLTAFLIAKLIGTLYQPAIERPFELLGVNPGASYLENPGFPSDHALFTAAITFAVWAETKSRRITAVLITLTLLVCVGRVLALVHTPLDVVGGILVAAIGAGWYYTKPPKKHPTKT
jgi:membrane-associated phospholipid phosphatase